MSLRETIRLGLEKPLPVLPAPPRRRTKRDRWRTPLLAAGFTLVVAISFFLILFESSLFRKGKNHSPQDRTYIDEQTMEGKRAIADGKFANAAIHFRQARERLDSIDKNRLNPESRWLDQMDREASIIADISGESINDILQLARGLGDSHWKEQFKARYENKAIIFDTLVYSAGGGVTRIDFAGYIGGNPVRIEIHGAASLRGKLTDQPIRLVMGARLGEARKEKNGSWLILMKPESVVLFTDPTMFQGSSVPVDSDMAEVLRRQAAMLDIVPPG
ncbi:MAG: hypothetical protein K8T89_21540 [Planctomycetes bacterium]|nr:hypothetical protein [Planctomycetota bacterium]